MKTKIAIAIAKGAVLGALAILAAQLASCAPRAFPVGASPLDRPGDAATAEDLQRGHLQTITGNPAL